MKIYYFYLMLWRIIQIPPLRIQNTILSTLGKFLPVMVIVQSETVLFQMAVSFYAFDFFIIFL